MTPIRRFLLAVAILCGGLYAGPEPEVFVAWIVGLLETVVL